MQAKFYEEAHDFSSGTNAAAAANSLLFYQLLIAWTGHLRSKSTFEFVSPPPPPPPPSKSHSDSDESPGGESKGIKKKKKKLRRPLKLLFKIGDLIDEDVEYVFSGSDRDEEGLPNGEGLLTIPNAGKSESCVRGICDKPIFGINGTFEHGKIVGFAHVIYSDGSVTLGHFHRETSALHGFSYTYSSHNQQILAAGYFHQGVPTGPFLRLDPNFQTGLFGSTTHEQGKLSGQFSLLEYGGIRAGHGVRGLFTDGVLNGERGELEKVRVDKVWFEEKGLMMRISVDREEKVADDRDKEEGEAYKEFVPGPNLSSRDDRFLVQSAWLVMANSVAAAAATGQLGYIRNQTLFDLDPPSADRGGASNKDPGGAYVTLGPGRCAHIAVKKPAPGAIRESFLPCYPGSGSKWILNLIQISSGLTTRGCSSEDDESPRHDAILIKTHHQSVESWLSPFDVLNKSAKMWNRMPADLLWRMRQMVSMEGRAVVLIRNPYEAIISFWQHDRSRTYDKAVKRGLKDLQGTMRTEMFRDFVKLEIGLWEEIYLDFLSYSSHVLVTHYENIKDNTLGELKKIHLFLGIPPGDQDRLECIEKHSYDKYKRKHQIDYSNPYDQELTRRIEQAIDKVQTILIRRKLDPLPLHLYKYREHLCQP